MNLYGSIDLLKLVNAAKQESKNGKTFICIPVDDNPSIFIGDKGAYLNVEIKESRNGNYNSTHFIKPAIRKDIKDKMSKEEYYKVSPILGNFKESGSYAASAPTAAVDNSAQVEDLPEFLRD